MVNLKNSVLWNVTPCVVWWHISSVLEESAASLVMVEEFSSTREHGVTSQKTMFCSYKTR